MKNFTLIVLHLVFALVLLVVACSDSPKSKLKGEWKAKVGSTKLKITEKQFIADNDSPLPEDYFVKGDTIFTSFQGSLPYSKFVIQKLDDHRLKLLYPDSTAVEFTK